jgi:hypothetical protein
MQDQRRVFNERVVLVRQEVLLDQLGRFRRTRYVVKVEPVMILK